MAEDICRKSAIIETYVMDSRRGNNQNGSSGREIIANCTSFSFYSSCLCLHAFSFLGPRVLRNSDVSGGAIGGHGSSQGDRGGLGSVLRDLVKPGDENLREMNKKLQHMLEEQLTKNMHLQKVTLRQ